MKRFVHLWLMVCLQGHATSLLAVNLKSLAQDRIPPPHTRPRRVEPSPESAVPEAGATSEPTISSRPFIRVALAVDVPFAVVSCGQEIIRIDEESQQVVRLAQTEIRVEPIVPDTLPEGYSVKVAVMRDRRQADGLLNRLKAEYQVEATLKQDGDQQQQVVYLGHFEDQEDAGGLARKLRTAGFSEASPVLAPPKPVLVGRSPENEQLLSVPSILTFSPLDPMGEKLRYSGRTYRGRIIVVLTSLERLSVINELPMEDYLKSVVPNELGPTSFGEIEALKAQAVAARTYAVRRKLQSANQEGYDLLADTRAQVYTGMDAEHPLSSRAVDETRGLVVTYRGEPIEALYSSTCGGRTENSETVFAEEYPYLRSVVCAPERAQLATRSIVSSRQPVPDRFVAMLQVCGIRMPSKWGEEDFQQPATGKQIVDWMGRLGEILGRPGIPQSVDLNQVAHLDGFARALIAVFYPQEYSDTLLTPADVDYTLDLFNGFDMEPGSRSAMAVLLRDGILTASVGKRTNAKVVLSRAEVLTALARLFLHKGGMELQTGSVQQWTQDQITIKPEKGDASAYKPGKNPFLFKVIAGDRVPVPRVTILGGETVWFHTDSQGLIDYLEVQPHSNGAAYDRYSSVSRWETRVKPAELTEKLKARGWDIGDVIDLSVTRRGDSQRVIVLEMTGTKGRRELPGPAIRSMLNLKDTLMVIDRRYDENGRVLEFIFQGRGWGHGVGLCQVGAYGLARQGAGYADILRIYYTGIELTKIY